MGVFKDAKIDRRMPRPDPVQQTVGCKINIKNFRTSPAAITLDTLTSLSP